ncbi:MAG: TlpA disulfide reductase family protein [Bacteroidota bacterium]|nr:TlpA disulfide reductase family protein [Bacteroidota bacterium]
MKKISYLIVLFLIHYLGFAQESEIHGLLPSYAGSELVFETYTDYITHETTILGKAKVLADGQFSLSVKLKKSREVFVKLGIYQAFIIIEPGKSYNILLPQKTEKSPQEKQNPFFEEIRIFAHQKLTDSTELNFKCLQLSKHINAYINKNLDLIATGRIRRHKVDSFILLCKQKFPAKTNSEFYRYRKYMIGDFRNLTYSGSMDIMAEKYFLDQPVLYNNQEYMKLFNRIFDKFFVFFAQGKYGKGISEKIIMEKSLSLTKRQIRKNPLLANDTLIEMLILKGLYDGYYLGDYELDEVVAILDSIEKSSIIGEHRKISENIRKKITKLAVSYPAPKFELFDKDSNLVRLDRFKGKYVYLNFCSYNNFASREDFVMLKELHKKYKDKLIIISVSIDDDAAAFFNFVKEQKYEWVCLSIQNQQELLKTYNARIIPTYYLIDPYSKILIAPSFSPRENFENEFHRILNNRN